ncbi:hypothetical protein EV284_0724 [Streptomyces sp. BK022]|nr:hypothetical protein EV284_0724 [Streptomyces sp. BK022]
MLHLATTAWFYRASAQGAWTPRLFASGALIVVGFAAVWLPPLAYLGLVDAILVVTAAVLARAQQELGGAGN